MDKLHNTFGVHCKHSRFTYTNGEYSQQCHALVSRSNSKTTDVSSRLKIRWYNQLSASRVIRFKTTAKEPSSPAGQAPAAPTVLKSVCQYATSFNVTAIDQPDWPDGNQTNDVYLTITKPFHMIFQASETKPTSANTAWNWHVYGESSPR